MAVGQTYSFASRALTPAERNYSQLKESLVIVWGKDYHTYLFGCHFVILSDHKPLCHLFKCHSATQALASAPSSTLSFVIKQLQTFHWIPTRRTACKCILSELYASVTDTPASVPEVPETVLLMENLDSFPITTANGQQRTVYFSKVKDLVMQVKIKNQSTISSLYVV